MRVVAFVLVAVLAVACGGGSGAPPAQPPLQAAPLLLAAGMTGVEPLAVDTVSPGVDLARLGMGPVDSVYDLTTPAGQAFAFDLISRANANEGFVRVSVAHASDGGLAPVGGVETLADAGILPSGTGVTPRNEWLDARGDGFARFTCGGTIDRDQVIAVEVDDGREKTTALVRVRIGPPSPINLGSLTGGDDPEILESTPLYSSDSWSFGLPTCAVAGDATSVVVYEGDRGDPFAFGRYELRLQYAHGTGAVTGGGEVEASRDFGHWRDHEIAALFNVIALVRSGTDAVTLKISFDRGATFGQEARFAAGGAGSARLAQIAMGADYTVAVLFWRTTAAGGSELVLVEGRPSGFDATNSPTRFAFDAPRVVYRDARDVVPLVMGCEYSPVTGDLAIGYGFSAFEIGPDRTWISDTQYRCATRRFGAADFVDTLVEQDRIVGKDPSVAILGDRIFYALEAADGIHVWTSPDFGRTWQGPAIVGSPGAQLPTVFVRDRAGATRVDVLYLAYGAEGNELHRTVWTDFGTTAPRTFTIVKSERIEGGGGDFPPPPVPLAQVAPGIFPGPDPGFRIRQVAWFGYDAVLDGDSIVVVYDRETTSPFMILGAPDVLFDFGAPPALPAQGSEFRPAEPPPLKEGLTEPMPPPDDEHRHVLCRLRLG